MANIEDVHKRLVELLRELIDLTTAVGTITATEAKQDDQIVIAQDQLTESETHTVQLDDIELELQQIKANQFTIESTNNKTTTPLGAGASWVGVADLNGYSDVMIVAETDQDGELYIQFSQDGTNWGFPLTSQYRTDRINAPHIYEKGYRYVRIGFNNTSANAQTYLRVAAYYGNHMTPLTAPINGVLAENYDATVVRPTNYYHEVAMGKRQGRSIVNKWGNNETINGGNNEEIIAAWSAAFDPATDIMKTAQTFTVTYTNTQDGAGQTGALMLLIDYLDESFHLAQAYHTLGSTGTDTTTFTGLGINRVVVISNGGAGFNNAAITFTATTDGTTQAVVPAQSSTTDQMIFHTPINHNLLAEWFWINVLKLSGGSSPRVSVKLYSWSRVTLTRYEVGHIKIDTAVNNESELKPPVPFVVGGREVFYATAASNSNNTEVESRMSGVLERVL